MLASEDQLTRNSYYLASAPDRGNYAPLLGDAHTDVCIVGGGLAGLSAALDLRQCGMQVVLLEGQQVGWGASGRNGGQALTGLACDMAVVEAQLGADAARAIWDITVEAVQLIHERRATFDIDCHWQAGFLAAAIGARRARELQHWVEQLEENYGYCGVNYAAGAQVQEWIASRRYAAVAHDARGGHLHPLLYTRGLARAAAGLGARIFEQSRALTLERGRRPVVRTATGAVYCHHVLLAGNVYLDGLASELRACIMPVGTFIGASARLDPKRARALIPTRSAVCDTQFVLDYFRLSADDRLLFGGRVSYSTIVPSNLAESMRARMVRVFPQLHDLAIEYSWGGFVDITMNRAPDFGRLDPNVYYVQGFSGHGLALAGMAGRLVAQAIRGKAERFDLFSRIEHRRFPGGRALRMPALILATAWYRLRDLLG